MFKEPEESVMLFKVTVLHLESQRVRKEVGSPPVGNCAWSEAGCDSGCLFHHQARL